MDKANIRLIERLFLDTTFVQDFGCCGPLTPYVTNHELDPLLPTEQRNAVLPNRNMSCFNNYFPVAFSFGNNDFLFGNPCSLAC